MLINIKKQQNMIFIAAIAASSIIFIFMFVYAPKKAELGKLKAQLAAVEADLGRIHSIVGAKEDIGKGIIRLRDEELFCRQQFINPENVGELIKILSDTARQDNVDVISIQPSDFGPCYDKNGSILKFDALECNRISIDMNLTGSYDSFFDYKKSLEKKLQCKLIVERFSIDEQYGTDKLKAHIVINAFTLIPPRKK